MGEVRKLFSGNISKISLNLDDASQFFPQEHSPEFRFISCPGKSS